VALLRGARVSLLPCLNPDGFAAGRRENGRGVDLNRNFPNQYVADPASHPSHLAGSREPETAAVMAWTAASSFDLAANFHGGALVAVYPLDGTASGRTEYSPR
jgi:carboxypeptidase D